MCRGNIQQRDLLFDIIRSKYSMMDTALNREPNACISAWGGREVSAWSKYPHGVNSYFVESTGAIVTTDSSIKLIGKYCESLPGDKYFDPKPLFQISSHSGIYECKLTLPANAAFPALVGPVSRSSYLAKQLVCLNACKKLHEIGALDDHLLPVIEEHIETNHDEIVNSALGAGTCTKGRKELHGSITARALSGIWANSRDAVALEAYKIDFTCNEDSVKYSSFVLLIDAVLDSDISHVEVNLNLGAKYVTSSVSPCGSFNLNAEQVPSLNCILLFISFSQCYYLLKSMMS
ncbi:unnamed protein product [Spirodela intermedia]|uniref:Dicer dsRNA-binding fold domain-containing protein n=1 Tax=Spirodela intermedia TaxID=51605 RepID=A0A7I8IT00_SPIIN|nr:unnamed protein product [Spirodela intermedia]CAA6660911.1 unnamed protein product [Spirodela intermedia]